MSVAEHKEKGKKSIRCFVVTVSDTRDEATDTSGQTIKSMLADGGHQTAGYRIVKDEPAQIEALLKEALSADVDAVTVLTKSCHGSWKKNSTASGRFFAI
jgi:molybdenum cofactor biosynthesis protein B